MTRKIILIPIWIVTLFLKPFLPNQHPWKHQDTTLEWWNRGATNEAIQCSFVMWFTSIAMIVIIAGMFR